MYRRIAIGLAAIAAMTGVAAAAPRTIRYGSPEFMRDVVYAPRPVLPQKAYDMNWKGTVIYRLHVRRDNYEVSDIKIVKGSGHPLLDRAALVALVQWKFRSSAPEYFDLIMDVL